MVYLLCIQTNFLSNTLASGYIENMKFSKKFNARCMTPIIGIRFKYMWHEIKFQKPLISFLGKLKLFTMQCFSLEHVLRAKDMVGH